MRKLGLLISLGAALMAQDLLIRNATVHTVSGPTLDNVSILVLGGKIEEIGPKVTAPKTAKNLKIIEAKGQHVFPGMIDSATELGLSEIDSIRESIDVGEIGDFNPQVRALVAVNPGSEHLEVVRANGITSAVVLPASGAGGGRGGAGGGLIGGQAAMIHLSGWTWEEMEISRSAAMQARFPVIAGGGGRGGAAARQFGQAGAGFTQARQNKDNQVRQLKEFFEEVRRYKSAKEAKSPVWKMDVKLDAMIPVLEKKIPVLVIAQREREIKEAIEWAEQEKVRLILGNVRKAGKSAALIASKKIPVIVSPTLVAPSEEDEAYDEAYSAPGELAKAGVKIAFGSFGNQFSRNLPYQAAMAVNFGLPAEEGLKAVTLNAAEIWGVADKYGSIEKGKFADLVITDGDILEARTHILRMFVHGQNVELESKHTRLYKQYLARP
jgi:imidazolonepropionase-like amidohydrolase